MKETDIRPEKLISRYMELSAEDADKCFKDSSRYAIPCVGCGAQKHNVQFTKNNFEYTQCETCGSLYQSPRPPIDAFEAFYRNSESSRFWAEEFFPAVAETRRSKIFKPRVDRLSDLCSDTGIDVINLVEVGAGYGIFLEEWRDKHPSVNALAIEPSESLANECRAKGFEVIEDIAENVTGCDDHADLVVCFEVLEHVYDPLEFMKVLTKMARPGGFVFISTLCIDGFDIQTLWEKSNSIFPPHHINFLSVDGFEQLFHRAGLENVDVRTPGVLDVDIVRNAARKDSDLLSQNRFVNHILDNDGLADSFQKFLSENKLSSHAWVIGRKPLAEESVS